MNSTPPLIVVYATVLTAGIAPASIVNAEALRQWCEEKTLATCQGLPPASSHGQDREPEQATVAAACATINFGTDASMPPADAWDHFSDDGYEADSLYH